MANPYPEGSLLFYIAEGARIYDEMVADPRHPYHQPCERVTECCGVPEGYSVPTDFEDCAQCNEGANYICRTHDKPWGECEVKAG